MIYQEYPGTPTILRACSVAIPFKRLAKNIRVHRVAF